MPTRPAATILVTKDVNLRMKAKAVGLMAEDYTTDHVKNIGGLYTGCRCLDGVERELVEALHREEQGRSRLESLSLDPGPLANEYLIVPQRPKSALATYRPDDKSIIKIHRKPVYGITSP